MYRILIYSVLMSFFLHSSCTTQSESNTDEVRDTISDEDISKENNQENRKVILFFGNSITAGYGLDPSEAFPAWVQQKIDSSNKAYQVVNAGLSGETTAAGVKRLDWILDQQDIDIFVLELGGNDGLRGIAPSETEKNLGLIIEKVKENESGIQVLLTGIEVPPNMGETYASQFRNVFQNVAKKYEVSFMPFILKDVGGIQELNQVDGIHPTVKGQQIIASNIWTYLEKMMD